MSFLTTLDGDRLRLKLLVLGDGTVGKSQLVTRYVEARFDPSFIVTIGVAFSQRIATYKGKKLVVQLWDAAGKDELHTMVSASYYKAAHGVVLVYDITNRNSFERLEYWKRRVDELCPRDAVVVVIGNKVDLVDEHMVSLRVPRIEEERMAIKLGVPFYNASAKMGDGVEEAFRDLVDLIIRRRCAQVDAAGSRIFVQEASTGEGNLRLTPCLCCCRCRPEVTSARQLRLLQCDDAVPCPRSPMVAEVKRAATVADPAAHLPLDQLGDQCASVEPLSCKGYPLDVAREGYPKSDAFLAVENDAVDELLQDGSDMLSPATDEFALASAPCQETMLWLRCCGL